MDTIIPLIDEVTVASLLAVLALLVVAYGASRLLLPSTSSAVDRVSFIWFAFDALTHFVLEGTFVYHSIFGRTVNTGTGAFATLWREYTKADARWGVADPTVVSLEILTVVGVGSLCLLILYQLVQQHPARHFWIVVVSVAELYGGWMTFCPEWLTGSIYLNTSNWLYLYVYLWFFNGIWVVIPLWLLYHSYGVLTSVPSAHAKSE